MFYWRLNLSATRCVPGGDPFAFNRGICRASTEGRDGREDGSELNRGLLALGWPGGGRGLDDPGHPMHRWLRPPKRKRQPTHPHL